MDIVTIQECLLSTSTGTLTIGSGTATRIVLTTIVGMLTIGHSWQLICFLLTNVGSFCFPILFSIHRAFVQLLVVVH